MKTELGRIPLLELWLSFVVMLFGPFVEAGQEQRILPPGRELPDALHDIPPAAGFCPRDESSASPGSLTVPKTDARGEKLDITCARTAQEAVSMLAQPESSLIDLRPVSAYQAWHAPDAINLRLSDILTKPYLRNKTLVLMGSGKLDAESYYACSRLRREGYRRVFVVRGGVLGWIQHGYATQGNTVKFSDAVKITPAELWAAAQFSENLIFLDADRTSMKALLPNSTLLSKDIVQMTQAVTAKGSGKQKTRPLLGLIMVTSATIAAERIHHLQQLVLPYPLLIYTGSELDYRAFVDQQKAVWAAQARGPKPLACGL